MRGRSKIAKKLARKHKNIIDDNMLKLKELREKEKAEREAERTGVGGDGDSDADDETPSALKRFF
eukprot:scaffold17604_cov71-Skeletonema_dohrnii-CCMP3373.AAC.3